VEYLPGERVRHPGQPEWGIGQVLNGASELRAPIFFVNGKRKLISFKYVQLERVAGKEAESVLLDNLAVSEKPDFEYTTLDEAIASFIARYPKGFEESAYLELERAPKELMHQQFAESLSENAFSHLLENDKFHEICEHILRLVKGTNFIFPNEKATLRKGLKDEELQALFARSLFALLYENDNEKARTETFFGCLKKLGAAKWTIATFFPGVAFPKQKLILKPPVTKLAAERSAFDLAYDVKPNWKTEERLQRFAGYLMKSLTEKGLPPQDMFDVYAFAASIAREPS